MRFEPKSFCIHLTSFWLETKYLNKTVWRFCFTNLQFKDLHRFKISPTSSILIKRFVISLCFYTVNSKLDLRQSCCFCMIVSQWSFMIVYSFYNTWYLSFYSLQKIIRHVPGRGTHYLINILNNLQRSLDFAIS